MDTLTKKMTAAKKQYFTNNGIVNERDGGGLFWLLVLFACCLYFLPFALLLKGLLTNVWLVIAAALFQSQGWVMMLGDGHEAIHKGTSSNETLNKIVSWLFELAGLESRNWDFHHNRGHHIYVNVYGPRGAPKTDGDLSTAEDFLVFSQYSKVRTWFRKYQYLFVLPLYSTTFIYWMFYGELARTWRYYKDGYVRNMNVTTRFAVVIVKKIAYFGLFIILPVCLGIPLWHALLMWLICVGVGGLTIMPILQMAHVNTIADQHEHQKPEGMDVFEHQIRSSVGFYWKNPILNWYCSYVLFSGLNFQPAHHLFPRVNRMHLSGLSKVLKKIAKENGISFYHLPSWEVFLSHLSKMKELAQQDGLSYEQATDL